jgi:hypothetical protein
MFYAKNLPTWERAIRLFGALVMGACAVRFWGTPLGYTFVVGSMMVALTSIVGFCPMCALAGRKITAHN